MEYVIVIPILGTIKLTLTLVTINNYTRGFLGVSETPKVKLAIGTTISQLLVIIQICKTTHYCVAQIYAE